MKLKTKNNLYEILKCSNNILSKEDINIIFKLYPDVTTQIIKSNFKVTYDFIKSSYGGDTFMEKLYQYVNNKNKCKCKYQK